MEKNLLPTSPYLIAALLLLAYCIGYLEIALLKKNFQFSVIGPSAIGISLVNVLLLYLITLVWIEFFYSMNWFVAIVAVVIVVICKIVAYRAIQLGTLYACLAPFVFFGSAKALILLIVSTTPDESALEASVRNNALLKLRVQLWMGGSDTHLQRPVEAAFETRNFDALAILYAYGNDNQLIRYQAGEMDESTTLKSIELMIVHGKRSNPGYKKCFYYSMHYGLPQLEFALNNGGYAVADFPDAMVEAVVAAMTYTFQPEAIKNDNRYDEFDKKIKRLIDYGFDINARTNGSKATALLNFLATGIAEEEKVLQILLHHGADVNLPALGTAEWMNWNDIPAGTTPLMMAVQKGQASYAQILLQAGADKSHKDFTGKTALDYAVDADLKKLLTP